MVHFGHYLAEHAVPEWQEKYINYKRLKKIIKNLAAVYVRKPKLVRRSSSFWQLPAQGTSSNSTSSSSQTTDNLPAALHTRYGRNIEETLALPTTAPLELHRGAGVAPRTNWETMVPGEVSERAIEVEFLAALEQELTKVNTFYVTQEAYVLKQINIIGAQLRQLQDQSTNIAAADKEVLDVACKELYRGLYLLKNYRVLNYTAIRKALKKHDKHSDFAASITLIPEVEKARIFWSETPFQVEQKLEAFYITVFSSGKEKKYEVIARLRGQYDRPPSLWTVWGLGMCGGISLCLCLVFILIVRLTPGFSSAPYFTAVFPVFRGIGLLLLYLWLWGVNVYLYSKMRINHVFILKAEHRSHLHHQEVWQGASILTVMYLLSMVVYFLLWTLLEDYNSSWRKNSGWMVGACFVLFLSLALCPFNVFHRSSRLYLAKSLLRIATAPLCKVKFIDFFFADQLCSLVRVTYDLLYGVCYIVSGSFTNNDVDSCHRTSDMGRWVLAFLPYLWRMLQCLRRYRDSGWVEWDPHLLNAGKYFSSIVLTFFSLMTGAFPARISIRALWVISAICGTLCSYAWDILKDWSLVEKWEKGGLRKKRVINQEWVYYGVAVIDGILRCSWVLTVSPNQFGLSKQFQGMALAAGEIFRRSVWNFFRMENEHLNNCGKFRAMDVVPLPALPATVKQSQHNRKDNSEIQISASNRKDSATTVKEGESNKWGTIEVEGAMTSNPSTASNRIHNDKKMTGEGNGSSGSIHPPVIQAAGIPTSSLSIDATENTHSVGVGYSRDMEMEMEMDIPSSKRGGKEVLLTVEDSSQ